MGKSLKNGQHCCGIMQWSEYIYPEDMDIAIREWMLVGLEVGTWRGRDGFWVWDPQEVRAGHRAHYVWSRAKKCWERVEYT